MSNYLKFAILATWLFLLLFWIISANKVKKEQSGESYFLKLIQYWLPLIIALYLLLPEEWFGSRLLNQAFLPHNNYIGTAGLLLSISGTFLACHARNILGRNWSLSIQQKENHELIETGPYRIIRHPIYTGLLLMFTGSGIALGEYRAILAILIFFASFWYKLMKEEKLLLKLFNEKYSAYRSRTKALIPYIL